MPDFNVRSDSVNVEQVMEQIRSRIRDKRGVDYTEEQIRELAAVKLEKFLDPRGVRSDLLAEFRKSQPPPTPYTVPLYDFEDTTLFDSRRAVVRFIRRLLRPLLKLVFNANALAQSLHQQAAINRQNVERFDQLETSLRQTGDLYYELLHNLVLELTRATIEVKNMKMRVESLASRLEFNERRARALESVVVYKPSDEEGHAARRQAESRPVPEPPRTPITPAPQQAAPVQQRPPQEQHGQQQPQPPRTEGVPEGPGQRSRRRRRRRGRRGGASAASILDTSTPGGSSQPGGPASSPGGENMADVGDSEPMGDDEGPEDGRDLRAEPFDTMSGSSSHPAEQQANAPGDQPARAADATPSSSAAAPPPPATPGPPDADSQ